MGLLAALHWILSEEPKKKTSPVPIVQELLISEQYLEKGKDWLKKSLLVDNDTIEQVSA